MSQERFFSRYESIFNSIQGMFSFEASLLMAAYAEVASEQCARADTLEIGVHHGLSAIVVAALRGDGRRFVAIDLFGELQDENLSNSGAGSRERFTSNMARVHGADLAFMRVIAAASSSLQVSDLGQTYSYCHIDGGHSAAETYSDLILCSQILMPEGILVIDDYFNPNFPGVSEGAVRFMMSEHGRSLAPVAIGFNKVLFQKAPSGAKINNMFIRRFPDLSHVSTKLWDQPVLHFGSNLSTFVDIDRSTAHKIVPRGAFSMQVDLVPQLSTLAGNTMGILTLPVMIENHSGITLCFSAQPMGLSYHLLKQDGSTLSHENSRCYFHEPLHPGELRIVQLPVTCPEVPGRYQVEIDLVWEGICWFKDRGNKTALVPLDVYQS